MENEIEILHYLSPSGRDLFEEWLGGLADARAQAKIATPISRLAVGNFGDGKPVRGSVCELRIDWGRGYRVYYVMIGMSRLLLLCGGDKRRQTSDIERAVKYFADYRERPKGDETQSQRKPR